MSQPERPASPTYTFAKEFSSGDMPDQAIAEWWTQFEDPALNSLILQALSANKSLDVAVTNIRVAEAITASQRLERTYSTNSRAGAEIGRGARPGQDVDLSVQTGLGASWELDLFGRIDAQIAAAEYSVDAARQARRDVAVIVASETARNYIELRGAQRRLNVSRQNAQTQAEGLKLLQTLLDNGRATQLDVERAQALYRTTLASQPRFEATVETSVSALAALLGQPANAPDNDLQAIAETTIDIPEHRGAIATGSVAALIRRRPDIREAEAVIARQLALGEVARANLFPRLTLNADLLSLFDQTNNVGDLSSFGFGIGPSLQWAGPDLRRVQADIDISDAQADLAIAQYEQTVIAALSEVEIALTNYAKELERRTDLEAAAASARRARELASLRFEEGLDDFLDVLQAQRTVLDAEDRLAESRLQASNRAITAYRALGGVGLFDINGEAGPEIASE